MSTATFQFSESGRLSCRNPYQTPHSLNCLPPCHWKTLFRAEKWYCRNWYWTILVQNGISAIWINFPASRCNVNICSSTLQNPRTQGAQNAQETSFAKSRPCDRVAQKKLFIVGVCFKRSLWFLQHWCHFKGVPWAVRHWVWKMCSCPQDLSLEVSSCQWPP